jgi:anaerobic magnesium-protoporphyrin IX monomethyl ester cyclase
MKILFLEKRLRTDKLGFLYLSAILKNAGHSVDMIQDDIDNSEDYIGRNRPDFVMYSVMTGEHQWFLEKNRELKKKFNFVSVAGGPHFTFFPEQGMAEAAMDIVVQGPGEDVILDIVSGRILDKLVIGRLPDVESLPYPDRSILYKYDEFGKARMKRFIAARYCHYTCKYCFNHLYKKIFHDQMPKFGQRLSPDRMIGEILDVKNKYPLEVVYFNDDDFPGDHVWLEEFCRKYTAKVDLPYCGSMRASSVNAEIIQMLADSGCSFMNIALESANPQTQKFLRRGQITNQQVEDACNDCKRFGIKVRLQNMIGLPVEDPLQDALDTLALNIKINPTDSWSAVFQPFPKTDLWKESLELGLITEDTQAVNFYEGTQLKIRDAEKINRLYKWWYFIVKHQLPMELVNILIELPLMAQHEKAMQDLRWDIAKDVLYGMGSKAAASDQKSKNKLHRVFNSGRSVSEDIRALIHSAASEESSPVVEQNAT